MKTIVHVHVLQKNSNEIKCILQMVNSLLVLKSIVLYKNNVLTKVTQMTSSFVQVPNSP